MTNSEAPVLWIASPVYDGCVSDYVNSVLQLCSTAAQAGIKVQLRHVTGQSLVTSGRNHIAANFLASPDSTHLMMLDADMGCDGDAAIKMLRANVDVIVAAYLSRDGRFLATGSVRESDKPGLFSCETAGAGCMMISRRALLRMIEAYPQLKLNGQVGQGTEPYNYMFFQAEQVDGDYVGEDYRFCQLWRAIGGTVYVDPTIRTIHNGQKRHVTSLNEHMAMSQALDRVRRDPEAGQALNSLARHLDALAPHSREQAWSALLTAMPTR